MSRRRVILILLVGGLLRVLHAQIPELLHYQGRLVDGGGVVNGNAQMSFTLFTSVTGGTALYQELQTVPVVDGLYSVSIGASNSTPNALASVFTNHTVYLEVSVNGSTLSPRERIAATSYALLSRSVTTGAITTAMLANGSVTGAKIVDGTIGSSDLGGNSVSSLKILDGSIGSDDLSDNAVTLDNFAETEDFYVDPDGTIHAKRFATHAAPNTFPVRLVINSVTQSAFLVADIQETSEVISGGKGVINGERTYDQFTLQRRLDTSVVWRAWMQNILDGVNDMRNITLVIQQSAKGSTVAQLEVTNAFPSRLEFIPLRYVTGTKGGPDDPTITYYERVTLECRDWKMP